MGHQLRGLIPPSPSRRSLTCCGALLLALLWPGLAPTRAAELSGQVVGYPAGEPLAFVSIMVVDPTGRAVVVQADAEGIWEAEDLPPGRYRVRAVPPHSMNRIGSWFGDTWSFCPADVVSLASTDRVDTLLHELPGGGWLDGRVTDASGEPVAGATIRATGLDFYNSATTREAESDGEGDYSVSGLDSITLDGEPVAGHYRLAVSAPGLATWYHPGTWDSGEATPVEVWRGETAVLDLALPELVSLSGRLVDEGGEGLSVLPVRATARVGGSVQVRTTDAEGFFLFDGLSGTDFDLQVDASGFARTLLAESISVAPGEQSDLGSFVLAPEAVLQGELEGMDVFEGSRLLLLDPQTGW
ncbi:MAG: carboxypeptidase-like regulatory domain-containing protein, partial [Myxococcota bacterium]|nr:carboxypeptidase-like regulatory domain-containing protein [Myxococcota bacterium]